MSYFSNFPSIIYNFNINGSTQLLTVKDIALNVRVRKEILEGITLYDEYDIEDGESPEIISEKLYGRPDYHWTIMLVNVRFDYIKDWPLRQLDLDKYITEKYGVGHEYDQHLVSGNLHYEDISGNIVTKLTQSQYELFYPGKSYVEYSYGFSSVSNYEYETRLNEDKRRIKVLNSTAVDKMVNDIQELLGG